MELASLRGLHRGGLHFYLLAAAGQFDTASSGKQLVNSSTTITLDDAPNGQVQPSASTTVW
jgi:hypothetical protein